MNDPAQGYLARPMVTAHLAPLLEPLLFAPAFIAVGWALVSARRGGSTRRKEHHD